MVNSETTLPDCLLVPTRNCKQSALCSGTNTTAGRSLFVFDHVMAHVKNSVAVLVQCEAWPSKREVPWSWWATTHCSCSKMKMAGQNSNCNRSLIKLSVTYIIIRRRDGPYG